MSPRWPLGLLGTAGASVFPSVLTQADPDPAHLGPSKVLGEEQGGNTDVHKQERFTSGLTGACLGALAYSRSACFAVAMDKAYMGNPNYSDF